MSVSHRINDVVTPIVMLDAASAWISNRHLPFPSNHALQCTLALRLQNLGIPMCGIAGIIRPSSISLSDHAGAARLRTLLHHRGLRPFIVARWAASSAMCTRLRGGFHLCIDACDRRLRSRLFFNFSATGYSNSSRTLARIRLAPASAHLLTPFYTNSREEARSVCPQRRTPNAERRAKSPRHF